MKCDSDVHYTVCWTFDGVINKSFELRVLQFESYWIINLTKIVLNLFAF